MSHGTQFFGAGDGTQDFWGLGKHSANGAKFPAVEQSSLRNRVLVFLASPKVMLPSDSFAVKLWRPWKMANKQQRKSALGLKSHTT